MPKITAHVGRTFEVTLYSHGGTGYSWCLTALPKGVALLDVGESAVKPGLPGGAVRQIFTFLGTDAGAGDLAFELLRPWEPANPADQRTYKVTVEKDVEANMKAAAGQESFPPLLTAMCDGEHDGKVLMESSTNCTLKYGIPPHGGGHCTMMYAVPVTTMGGPIIAKYMAQPPRK